MKKDLLKKGKQEQFVNEKVKSLDDFTTQYGGENLFGESVDNLEIDRIDTRIQLGNLRIDRNKFANPQGYRVISPKGVCETLTVGRPPLVLVKQNGKYRVRRLTGRECMRLMGVEDEDIDKLIEGGMSETQLYKLAGNSIIVDVMSGFYKNMVKC